jgi:hypothetical protein
MPELELARDPRNSGRGELGDPRSSGGAGASEGHSAASSLPGASGLNRKIGPSIDDAPAISLEGEGVKTKMSRCSIHGLYFDQSVASGCRKCLEPAKQLARQMERNAIGFKLLALRDDPPKRAFLGLTIALLIGMVPALWHALAIGRSEVLDLRTRQEVLSTKVGTDAVRKEFHAIDAAVHEAHGKHRRNTAIVWVIVSGGALFGWYRLT